MYLFIEDASYICPADQYGLRLCLHRPDLLSGTNKYSTHVARRVKGNKLHRSINDILYRYYGRISIFRTDIPFGGKIRVPVTFVRSGEFLDRHPCYPYVETLCKTIDFVRRPYGTR